jgi:hypothetical protein
MDAYIYRADIHCGECNIKIVQNLKSEGRHYQDDSEVWPQGPYENGGGEADHPQHCGNCQVFMENSLTSDGEDYVIAAAKDALGGEVAGEWKDYYSYLFQ